MVLALCMVKDNSKVIYEKNNYSITHRNGPRAVHGKG